MVQRRESDGDGVFIFRYPNINMSMLSYSVANQGKRNDLNDV